MKSSDHIFFAYTYPFSNTDVNHSISKVQEKCLANGDAYFNLKTIGQSLEERPIQ